MSSTHETIEYDRRPSRNVRDLVNTAVHTGTIIEVNYNEDTAKVNINGIVREDISIFYHCADSEEVAGGSVAFKEGDEVYILEKPGTVVLPEYIIIGFVDGLKSCGWLEDWEGETITSNHPWFQTGPAGGGCCASLPNPKVISFQDSNWLQLSVCDPGNIPDSNGCKIFYTVDLKELPEKELNLANLSEFTMDTYFKKIYKTNTLPCSTTCYDDGHYIPGTYCDWAYGFEIIVTIGWGVAGGAMFRYADYGLDLSKGCWYGDISTEKYNVSSWAELKAKEGTWENLRFLPYPYNTPSDAIPWGDKEYAIQMIRLACFTRNWGGIGTTEIIMYFDNILIR